ncbi:MAG: DNA repair protein RecO, partial [Nitrospiraceae bacterium]
MTLRALPFISLWPQSLWNTFANDTDDVGVQPALSFATTGESPMPLIKTAAITLKSRKWGDADRIVTFYSKELGKVRGVARGARRMKSRLGASLEPLTICH